MTESKHKSIKTLKEIHIPTYIRGSDVVKGYFRLQNVRIPELNKNTQFRSIDELVKHSENLNYNDILTEDGKLDPEKFQKEILDLYSDGITGIYDSIFTRRKDSLLEVYNAFGSSSPIHAEEMDSKLVLDNLTDSNNLRKLHQISKTLEKKFNDDFNLETERVNPFIFRTKLNLHGDLISENPGFSYDIINTLKIPKIFDELGLPNDTDNLLGIDESIKKIYAVISDSEISKQKLQKTVIPALLLTSISEEYPRYLSKEVMYEINNNLHDFMKSDNGLPDDLKNYNAILKDPDNDIKKPLNRWLNELGKNDKLNQYLHEKNIEDTRDNILNKAKELSSYFKEIKSDEVVPTFMEMMETKQINTNYNKNPEFKKIFNTLVGNVSSFLFDAYNSRHDYVYVSNNPMDFVTMSPHGSITSCQSISDYGGGLGVSRYNINIMNSIALSNSHDFIMYTLSTNPAKKNIKTNRISLHYNKLNGDFNTYEGGRVYSKDRVTNWLGSFLFKNEKLRKNIKENNYSLLYNVENACTDLGSECISKYKKLSNNSSILSEKIKDDLMLKKITDFNSEEEIEKYGDNFIYQFNDEIGKKDDLMREFNNLMNLLSVDMYEVGENFLKKIISNCEKTNDSMLYGSTYYEASDGLNENSGLNETVSEAKDNIHRIVGDCLYDINYNRSTLKDNINEWIRDKKNKFKKH